MSRLRLALAGTVGITALLAAPAAMAQSAPMAASVLDRACIGKAGEGITRADIAQALVIESGIPSAQVLAGATLPPSTEPRSLADAYGDAVVEGVRTILGGASPSPARTALRVGVHALQDRLNDQPEGVTVERPGGAPIELFGSEEPTWRIRCKVPDPAGTVEDPPSPPARFAIRETAEELWLRGRARRKAGAFSLGFERSRSVLEDGTRKTENSLTVDGTAGVRITPGSNRDFHAYLFGTYNLERDRTRPAPTLGAGEKESDGDTNALATGIEAQFSGCAGGCIDGLPLDFSLQAATIFDFANDASRVRLRALLTPRPVIDLGLCRVSVFSAGPLRSRCEFSAEVQLARVLQRGTTELGDHDTFVAIGGRAGLEIFLPTGPGEEAASGFLASVKYRFLPVIQGAPDDIERLELKLAHRFWTSFDAGVDVGFTYTKGTNELSFKEEDILTFGLGLIF